MGCGASQGPPEAKALSKVVTTGVMVDSATGGKGYPGAASLFQVADNTLYLAGSKGISVVDISKPTQIKCGEKIDTGAISHDGGAAFAKAGSTVFVAGGHGLRVLDASDINKPVPVGEVIITGALGTGSGVAMALYESEDAMILYVAGCKGMAVYDVKSDPANPVKIGDEIIDTGVLAAVCGVAMTIVGKTLYVGGGGGRGKGFASFDITDPKAPTKLGQKGTDVLGKCAGAAMISKDDNMYIVGGSGLETYNISTPSSLTKVGESEKNTGALSWTGGASLAIYKNNLFVAGGKGLGIFDISAAGAPVKRVVISTGAFSDTGPTTSLVVGGYTYFAGGKGMVAFNNSMLDAKSSASE